MSEYVDILNTRNFITTRQAYIAAMRATSPLYMSRVKSELAEVPAIQVVLRSTFDKAIDDAADRIDELCEQHHISLDESFCSELHNILSTMYDKCVNDPELKPPKRDTPQPDGYFYDFDIESYYHM